MNVSKLHIDKEIPPRVKVMILELADVIINELGNGVSQELAAMRASQVIQSAFYAGKIEGMETSSRTWKNAIDKAVKS